MNRLMEPEVGEILKKFTDFGNNFFGGIVHLKYNVRFQVM